MGVQLTKTYKAPGIACKHERQGGGCKIYAKRPDGCSNFLCAWLTIKAMPDFTRPDKLGVHFHYDSDDKTWNPFAKACVMASPVGKVVAMYNSAAIACYTMFWNVGTPVCFNLPDRTRYFVDEKGAEITADRLMDYQGRISNE